MSTNPEEEDEELQQKAADASTRRAFFAGRDVGRAEAGSGLESGAWRGVPTAKHGGSQSVKPEDTAGSLDLCWCGLPYDHNWPGKAQKRPHPRKVSGMSQLESAPPQRVERTALRGYNSDVADIVMKAVNEFGARYKFTNSSVVLYPPDGSAPFTVRARNGERGVKTVQRWFVAHCVPLDMPIKTAAAKVQPKAEVDDEVVKELAEAIDSEEHLRKLLEPRKSPTPAPSPPPTQQIPLPSDMTEVPASEESEDERETPKLDALMASEEWVPYYTGRGKGHEDAPGKIHPFALTNGVDVMCPEHKWIGKPTGLGGHTRTHHRDTTNLWDKAARMKAEKGSSERKTYFTTKVRGQVEQAMELLHSALGVEAANTGEIESLKEQLNKVRREDAKKDEQIKALREENGKQGIKLTELGTQVTELKAKLSLLREAFSNLEE